MKTRCANTPTNSRMRSRVVREPRPSRGQTRERSDRLPETWRSNGSARPNEPDNAPQSDQHEESGRGLRNRRQKERVSQTRTVDSGPDDLPSIIDAPGFGQTLPAGGSTQALTGMSAIAERPRRESARSRRSKTAQGRSIPILLGSEDRPHFLAQTCTLRGSATRMLSSALTCCISCTRRCMCSSV